MSLVGEHLLARIPRAVALASLDDVGVLADDAVASRIDAKLADLRVALTDKITGQTRWVMASQLVLVAATIGSITTIAH